MDKAVKSYVTTKIFIGFELKIDLKIALRQNPEWKAASVSKTTELREIYFQEKEYIGIHLEHKLLTMKQIQEHGSIVRKELELFCPHFNTVNLKINIFPQVFVA